MASEGDRRAGPEVAARSSKVLGGGGDARNVTIALASTICFFVLIAVAITHAPGWHEVRRTFFDWGEFKASAVSLMNDAEDLLAAREEGYIILGSESGSID